MASGPMMEDTCDWRTGVTSGSFLLFFFFFSSSLNFGESENDIFLADIPHFPSPLNVLPAPTGSKLAHEKVSSSGSA